MTMSTAQRRAYYSIPQGVPMNTPWGQTQSGNVVQEGVYWVSTAGHGGYKLSAKANARIPEAFRVKDGWYEEDCDWAIPAFFLALPDADMDAAHKTLKNWHWRAYEAFFKCEIPRGESFLKDEYLFAQDHANDWVVICAFGDWEKTVPNGMIGCIATKGGKRGHVNAPVEEKKFLVPDEEYKARGRFGFVIDPARHLPWNAG